MTRILIADDHHVVRSGLRSVLEAQPGFEVVGEAANGQEAVEAALKVKPDVIVLDYAMPVRNGVEATREIRSRLPRTEVLIFTMHDSQDVIEDILAAGARGYLLKADANDHLITAVQALGRHEAYISGKLSANLLDTLLDRRKRGRRQILTPRERSVVQLIAEGNTNKSIGAMLGVSLKTIETHRAAAMRKLGLHTTADIVLYAVKNRMIEV
ncbi:response regulator [Microvirga terrestris]|uniref:Response regulator transcription factor n=1 Tax=Microvirga terrestris TaxID=2791024 RepID=A0ABS0HXP1_9HYPH|nr:response regulator transcription factor [Microvirga terrestris]